MHLRRQALLLWILLAAASPIRAQSDTDDDRFTEAMAVCDNMTQYVDAAKRQRTIGMPLNEAKDLARTLMEKNLKLPGELKTAAIDLVSTIYDRVYGAELVSTITVDKVLIEACGSYRGYRIPEARVREHVLSTAQSAWNPLERVPLCTKVAQSTANLASGRDRGLSRDRMLEVAQSSLARDPFTQERLPAMLEWVYSTPNVPVSQLYAYALLYCRAEVSGKPFPGLSSMREALSACASRSMKSEEEKCTLTVLQDRD